MGLACLRRDMAPFAAAAKQPEKEASFLPPSFLRSPPPLKVSVVVVRRWGTAARLNFPCGCLSVRDFRVRKTTEDVFDPTTRPIRH